MGNWYDIGFEANDKLIKENAAKQREREKNRERMKLTPRRFWIKRSTSTQVIFLDDSPFCIYEYNVNINGEWGNYFTCVREKTQKDPFAKYSDRLQMKRTYMGFLTILDCTKYTDKTGKVRHYTKKLLPVTSKTLEKIATWKSKKGSLVGLKYDVTRSNNDKSEKIGDDWQFAEKVDLTALRDADGTPIDLTLPVYPEILAPLPEAEIIAILENAVSGRLVDLPPATTVNETERESSVPF